MKHKKYWIFIGLLLVFSVMIRLFSANARLVEQYYSNGIYPPIAAALRYLLGWLPLSIGDIIYGGVVVFLLVKLVKMISLLFKKDSLAQPMVPRIQRVLVSLLLIYIVFNTLWGINYNRKGIASQLGLTHHKYSLIQLKTLNALLLNKVNESKDSLLKQPAISMDSKLLYLHSVDAYRLANKQYPFLDYHPASIKSSMWGWLGNYLGFLGYYNPFTGEGQVNITIPAFLQPYTYCHEIAHQLGYAKEDEANFVGYLAAISSKEKSFHYSAYLELFLYANNNLFQVDSLSSKAFRKQLHPSVKADLQEWKQFNARHKNPVEPIIRWIYGKYLEGNEQPAGMLSYDEVTGYLIAFYEKNGRL